MIHGNSLWLHRQAPQFPTDQRPFKQLQQPLQLPGLSNTIAWGVCVWCGGVVVVS
eukprot:c23189_g1_i1 orf=116-280(-)